jgi:glycogen debranching enzyme
VGEAQRRPAPPSPYEGASPVASTAAHGEVTLIESQTFCISTGTGDISREHAHGLFMLDRRVLSGWELRINGRPTEALAVELDAPYACVFVVRGHPRPGHADGDVVVLRRRHVGWGMRETIQVTNHGLAAAEIEVALRIEADFADIFAVKEQRVHHTPVAPVVRDGALRCDDPAADAGRTAMLDFSSPPLIEGGTALWRLVLAPRQEWELCCQVHLAVGGATVAPLFVCGGDDRKALPAVRLQRWEAELPTVVSDDPVFSTAIRRSGEDLGALQLADPERPGRPVLAAGAPWFMTLFGRDSLLTAWMALIADVDLARGVLETLGRFQGDDEDPQTDEEPGKILHELRVGGTDSLTFGGREAYYGTVDATPLFVMLVGELHRWSGHLDGGVDLLSHADRALEWIERFGDRDGDGYVEYERRSATGLVNQGWKDSWDAVRHAHGSLAAAPIALCEVQGYVYAAYVARAQIAQALGDDATAARCAARADELRRRFQEDFWSDELGTYVMALDREKRPVAVPASNPGHCLWTGIVDEERALSVADRLLDDGGFSGWGVRTLSRRAAAYNPVSYHNGSVWPHDNALCAAGLARYGLVEHAHRVIEGQLDAAGHFEGRLPELFAGFGREEVSVPAAYPASCSPQAWASAAPLLWLRSLLRLDPDSPAGQIWLAPQLPDRIGSLRLEGVKIGDQVLSLAADRTGVEVEGAGDLRVIDAPRPVRGPTPE